MFRKRRLLIVSVIVGLALLSSGLVWSFVAREPMLKGINLPSGTFGAEKIPGEYGRDYFYPDRKDVDFYTALGMNVFRIGFMWERMQPQLMQPLDRDEVRRLDGAVRAALGANATVILDLHNFGRYRGQVLGSPAVPGASLADFWKRLSQTYKDTDGVMFGLMNEPHDIEPGQWRDMAQAAISSIRQVGANNRILVATTSWASAAHFVDSGPVWKQIADPGNNFAFEVHQYVDADASGTHGDCPDIQVGRRAIQVTTDWMRENNRRVFLGEFGASTKPECLSAVSKMLAVIDDNPGPWVGWTYFAGGRGWSDSDLLPIPTRSDQNRPQLTLLRSFLEK